ncbi:MAG: sugar phosphate isomerase/epimerase [Clostridia bacterium]|nr:sugar phosphate isomerase/epimerase [Clostridia bacterium]
MKFAVTAWSYHQTGLDLFAMADHAKKIGFDAFEVLDLPCPVEEELDYAKRFRAHCDEIGLEIVSAAVAGDFLNGCDGDLQAEIDRLCRKVDVAKALGVTKMRHDVTWRIPDSMPDATFEDVLPRLAEGARAVTEYAQKLGIRTMTENHGTVAQGWRRMVELVKAVNHPNYGILVDMGNCTWIDDVPVEAVREMMPYAFHVHCKDLIMFEAGTDKDTNFSPSISGRPRRGTIVGHGNVDVKACLAEVKKAGYDDVLVVEFEGLEESYHAIEASLLNVKRFWEAV